MPSYQKALLKHIEESAASIKNYEVDTVYFGGGTPSYYGADRICEILDLLKYNGNLRTDSEITVEANPDSISLNAMKLLRGEGVNRLSIGVQSADNDLLKLIGRRHNFQQAQKAVSLARDAGFENLSIDLIYGLPTQTKHDWAETLQRCVELHTEHISVYGLTLEEGTPMHATYSGSLALPSEDEQADMYVYASQMLERYGYKQYEISNFCAPGFASRHNLKYWRLDDYMGFGPGAHSCIGKLRYSYIKDLKAYISGVESGAGLLDEYETQDRNSLATEYVMLAMRTSGGMSEKEYRRKTQSDWKPIEKALSIFQDKGWAEKAGERWRFTTQGFLLSNQLINVLLEVQTGGRIENTPWLAQIFDEEEKTELPKSEEELFLEIYAREKEKTEENPEEDEE